ncbi:DUF3298 domain-containing protein [Aggregatibacter kilianii]|uniref:DUF3298 domain-containing protein n=1 Tax=Aggregatibacter kilianii TaxID=2025884 RepID=UPI000D65BDAB|nr:DUF3298 domain-containing protein [Aggregatibacter kilianii]
MKKNVISSLILTALFLTGCEDKDGKIAQLQQTLTQQEQTINQLNQENTQLKIELATGKAKIPAVMGEKQVIFEKGENVKFAQKDEFAGDEGVLTYSISTFKTNIDWLNKALLQAISLGDDDDNMGDSVEQLQQVLTKHFEAHKKELAEMPVSGIDRSSWANFISQRGKLALFEVANYAFDGGAHGFGFSQYWNFDLAQQKALKLEDIFEQAQLEKVKEQLWKRYLEEFKWEESEAFTNKANFYVSTNFYLTNDGMTFSYAPYAIAAYAVGQPELSLTWGELNKLVKPEFKQQGYYSYNE